MTNIPADARFQVTKETARKWFVTDTANPGSEPVDGPYKARHLAEVSAEQLNADNPTDEDEAPAPDVDQDAVDRVTAIIEAARAAAHEANDGVEFQPTVEVEPPTDPAAMDRTQRILAAKAEVDAVRAWKAAGCEGDSPATPVLDWMADPANGTKVHAARSTGKRRSGALAADEAAVIAKLAELRAESMSWKRIGEAFADLPFRTTRGEPLGEHTLYLIWKRHTAAA